MAKAVTKFFTTPRGAQLYNEYDAAPNTPAQPNARATDSSPTMAKIEELAKAIVTKSEKKLTSAQAMTQVLGTPEGDRLYQEYLAEHSSQ